MKRQLGLHKSRKIVFKLSSLFALDAFAGGFVIQSLIVYWFHIKFIMDTGILGTIFFGANVLAGISALVASTGCCQIRINQYYGIYAYPIKHFALYRSFKTIKPPEET